MGEIQAQPPLVPQAGCKVLLISDDPDVRQELQALAKHHQIQLLAVADCDAAHQAMLTARWDVVLIAVSRRLIDASLRDDVLFANETRHRSIHCQNVGDVGAFLAWTRSRPRTHRVSLLCDDHPSTGLPLIFRLLGCHSVVWLTDLRRELQKYIQQLCQAPALTDRLSHQIFLSYVGEDREDMRCIYQCLMDLNLAPWIDFVNLLGGGVWYEEICRAISQSTFFLPHFSPNAFENQGVFKDEIAMAYAEWQRHTGNGVHEDRYHLIPILLKNGQHGHLPPRLQELQWVDITTPHGLTKLLQAILRGVKQPLPRGDGEHVLVVDTNRDIGARCVQRLQHSGYLPCYCRTVKEARRELAAHPTCFRVILLDFQADKTLRFVHTLGPQLRNTKIIVTTLFGAPLPEGSQPIFRYLLKNPYQFEEEMLLYVSEALRALRQDPGALL